MGQAQAHADAMNAAAFVATIANAVCHFHMCSKLHPHGQHRRLCYCRCHCTMAISYHITQSSSAVHQTNTKMQLKTHPPKSSPAQCLAPARWCNFVFFLNLHRNTECSLLSEGPTPPRLAIKRPPKISSIRLPSRPHIQKTKPEHSDSFFHCRPLPQIVSAPQRRIILQF
jgi:hypothetical protein